MPYFRWPAYLPLFLATALGFFFLGGVSLVLAIPPGYAIPLFPAAGFALVAVLHFGTKVLPAIWIGSFAFITTVILIHNPLTPTNIFAALGIASGSALQALAGSRLIQRLLDEKWKSFASERDTLRFLVAAGPVVCTISATVSVICQLQTGMINESEAGFVWWSWFLGDVLGTIVFAPLMIGWLYRDQKFWSNRFKLIILPSIAMFAVISVTLSTISNLQFNQLKTNIDEQGQKVARTLDNRIVAMQEILTSLASFIEVSQDLNADQFNRFSQSILLAHPDIAALSFNPIVPNAKRQEFEDNLAINYPHLSPKIMERDSQGALISSPIQQDYVVVAYIAPLQPNAKAIGFNINSESTRGDAITRSRQTGQSAITSKINLVQDNQSKSGALVLTPVTRKNSIQGFAVGVIKVSELVEIATNGLLHDGIELEISDPIATEEKQLLYFSGQAEFSPATAYIWETKLKIADREWILKVLPSHAYIQAMRPIQSWLVGVIGILLTAMLQVLVLGVTGRNNLIQQRIDEQTAELHLKNTELTKSKARYVSVVNHVKEIIFQTDTRGNWTFLNPSWTSITGFSVESSLETPCLNYIHQEDRLRANKLFISLIEGRKSNFSENRRPEIRYLNKSGDIRWMEITIDQTLDDSGKLIGTSGTLTDITERKQIDRRLQLAATVFTHANEGILITTPDSRIVDVNDAFTAITGYSKDEVIGKTPKILKSEQHNSSFLFDLRQKLKQSGKWHGEVWNRRKNGEAYAEMLSVSEVKDDNGQLQNYIAIFSDITVLKNQQQQLEHIAHYDPLTSLPNRLLLADRMNRAMTQVTRRNIGFVVAYIDIDGFKQINDNFGHAVGDRVLQKLAKNMGHVLRAGDTLARIGGDEFIALLLDLKDIDSCIHLLERILTAAQSPIQIGNTIHLVSASIGVTYYPQETLVDYQQLLSQSDQAMYQAKLEGKNRYHLYAFES